MKHRDTDWGADYDSAGVFTVSAEGQLAQLAFLVNGGKDFSGKRVVLTAELDLGELTDARLALRQQMEAQAKDRIRGGMSSGKIRFWDFRASVQNVDKLLGEGGLTKWWELEKDRQGRNVTNKPYEQPCRKPFSQSYDR